MTPAGFANPKPESEWEPLPDRPLGCRALTNGPGAPQETPAGGLERAPQSAAGAAVRGLKPRLLKCGGIADASWVPSGFWGLPGSLGRRAEPSGAFGGDQGKWVGILLSRVSSPLRERGAARAGGRALPAGDFLQGPDRGAVGGSGAQVCGPLPEPGANPLCPGLGAEFRGGRGRGERLERTSGACAPCAVGAHSWFPSPFFYF